MQEQYIEQLSSSKPRKRIKAYKKLLPELTAIKENISKVRNVNVQVRTGSNEISPSLAVYKAKRLSLPLISIVNYASLSAYKELACTAEPSFIAFYSGAEVLVSSEKGTAFKALAIGIPEKQAKRFDDELSEYRKLRLNYLKKKADLINQAFKGYKIKISHLDKGGLKYTEEASEKAVYALLADAIMKKFLSSAEITEFLQFKLKFSLSEEDILKLEDLANPLYKEDLTEVLESKLSLKQDAEKCKSYRHFVALTLANGAIPSAVYQGNASGAEDFVLSVKDKGFLSVTVEHGDEETARAVYFACIKHGMLPLCRVLVGGSRGKADAEFKSEELATAYNECAYAVVGHEICTAINFFDGLFSRELLKNMPNMEDRIKLYSRIGAKGSV